MNMRRGFLKTALLSSAVATLGAQALTSGEKTTVSSSHGVVKGHSKKKEITYKKTQAWEDYYKSAL